jgi:type I restriction enzyme S subunit
MTWGELTLGEVIKIKHGWAFKGEFFDNNGDYILLTPGNVFETGGLKLKGEKEKYYTGEFSEEYLLKSGDMIVVMTDLIQNAPILGASLIIPEDNRYLLNQRLGLVQITDPSIIDYKFLYYVFNSPIYRGQVRGTATGATVRHTAPKRIYQCKIPYPVELYKQQKIAGILSAYDDLIANNERRIGLLEEAMHLLYREWFVHLRFPGWEETEVEDGMPEGWEKRPLGELCDVTMGQSPKSEFYNSDGDGLPFHQGVKDFGGRFISHQTYCTQPNRIAEAGDILFSVRAPVGRMNYTLDKIIIGRGLAAMRNRARYQSFQFYQLQSNFFKEDMIGGGAIFASVTKKRLLEFPMLTPKIELIQQFEEFSKPADSQIANLHHQNQRLREARDALLPRLMSGRIEV